MTDGFCSTAEKEPVKFGFNSTSGCLLLVSQQNLTQCHLLRSVAQDDFGFGLNLYVFVLNMLDFSLRNTVASLQEDLTTASYVAKSGNPDPLSITDWVNISCK